MLKGARDMALSIIWKPPRLRRCAASVCVGWCSAIETASAMGMLKSAVLCVSAGADDYDGGRSVVCTTGGTSTHTFGSGVYG